VIGINIFPNGATGNCPGKARTRIARFGRNWW
jgi:hypothetical protein